jgi:hypothetical protein
MDDEVKVNLGYQEGLKYYLQEVRFFHEERIQSFMWKRVQEESYNLS